MRERSATFKASLELLTPGSEHSCSAKPGSRTTVASPSLVGPQQGNLAELASRALEGDTSLSWLDLSGHVAFARYSQAQKSAYIESMARAPALETLILNSVGLDGSNAEAIVALITQNAVLEGLSLEGNALTEPTFFAIADALPKSSLSELCLANQRKDMSTEAVNRLLSAMEKTPTLVSLSLGTLHDDAVRRRHQRVSMANVEAMRVRRQQARALCPCVRACLRALRESAHAAPHRHARVTGKQARPPAAMEAWPRCNLERDAVLESSSNCAGIFVWFFSPQAVF